MVSCWPLWPLHSLTCLNCQMQPFGTAICCPCTKHASSYVSHPRRWRRAGREIHGLVTLAIGMLLTSGWGVLFSTKGAAILAYPKLGRSWAVTHAMIVSSVLWSNCTTETPEAALIVAELVGSVWPESTSAIAEYSGSWLPHPQDSGSCCKKTVLSPSSADAWHVGAGYIYIAHVLRIWCAWSSSAPSSTYRYMYVPHVNYI